jgi:hypothetical protein
MAKETKKTETKARKAPARKPATTRARRRAATHDDIARRAYELHLAGGADPFHNWVSAERELRTG